MKLYSINISELKTLEYNGKEYQTGIYKSPITGSINLMKNSLEGDQCGDKEHHGGEFKAIYSYSLENYKKWEKILNKDSLAPGTFGENFTLDAPIESTLNIGDHLKIGNVILEATQPRIPCAKLNIVFKDNTFLKTFLEQDMPGIYFKVIKEGVVQANDPIELVYKHPAQFGIIEAYKLYKGNYKDSEKLEKLLQIDILDPWLRWYISQKLSKIEKV